MSEPDTSDELQTRIEEAKASGDMARANELYQRQIGNVDPYGEEAAAVPAVAEVDPIAKLAEAEASRDVVVATDGADETVTVSGEMDFAGNPEHVAYALEQMAWWDQDENGQPNGDSVEQLKAEWGSDMGANLGYFQAFASAHPDVHEILVASGFGDHPAIIKAGAILGRRYATKAGDPSSITTRKAKAMTTDTTNTTAIEAKIEALQEETHKAQALNNTDKANRLYQEMLRLEALLPGGTDPAIGEGGRTV